MAEKKPRRSGVQLALSCGQRLTSLKGDRSVWDALWDDLARYIMPRKANLIYHVQNSPGTQYNDVLFDSTAVQANQVLANGMLSYITPSASAWFSLDAPSGMDSDSVKQWFQKCTEILRLELARSNFAAEIHEYYNDSGAFGTACIVVMPGKQASLNFQTQSIASYYIAEDDEGIVDTLFRELNYDIRKLVQKFGIDALSPKMKEAWAKFQECGKIEGTFPIGHAIYPRSDDDREPGKADKKNKPWASVYWSVGDNHVIENTGFDEKPFFAGRFLKWGDSVYGYCPGWMALPEARQVNFLVKQMDALAEVSAFPRFLVPSTMVDEVDLRAGGMTVFNENMPNALPKEWMTGGRYDIGLDREKLKKEAIEKAFYVDMFKMFASLDKQMTAREVAERSAEKLVQFTPAFDRLTTEVISPLLRRCFGILTRAGKFPAAPTELQINTENGPAIPDPEISYNSRIALAIKSLENTAFYRSMELLGPMAANRPDILDNFDLDTIARDSSRNDGMPADWLLDEDERDKIRDARAQEIQKAQEMQMALAASEAAKNAGSVKSDSALAGALQKAA